MDGWFDRLQRGWTSRAALNRSAKIARSAIKDARAALGSVEDHCQRLLGDVESIVESAPTEGTALVQVALALQSHAQPIRDAVRRELRHFQEGLAAKEKRLHLFTVTLFGRTMAGKSTIREAITGGDGSTIGKGAQRTTRDIREYPWRYISLVDTPGFGAFEGADDRQLAFTKVDESDLIVFLLSSDGVQEEAFREMAELNRLRKPVLFVLNVKHDLTVEVLRRRFLADPARHMGEVAIRGHRDRVQELVEKHFPSTLHEVRLLPVHAQAAWMSRGDDHARESRSLRAASGIVPLLHELEDELRKRGPSRRVQTIIGGSSTVIRLLAGELESGGTAFKEESRLLSEKSDALALRIHNYASGFPTKCRVAVRAHYAPLRNAIPGFIESNIRRGDIEDCWKKQVQALKTDEWANELSSTVAGEIEEFLEEFRRELDFDLKLLAKAKGPGIHSSSPVDWQKVARRAAVALAVTGAILFIVSNPAGWVMGIIAGVGLVLGLIAPYLPGEMEQLDNAKREARKKLEETMDNYEAKTIREIEHWFSSAIHKNLLMSVLNEVSAFRDGVAELAAKAEAAGLHFRKLDANLTAPYHKDHIPFDHP